MIESLYKSILVVMSAIAGTLLIFTLKLDHKKLCSLISISAGALLGAAIFTLLPEAGETLGIIEVIISCVSGYLVFYFISKYYSHVCPACSASHFDEQTTKRFSEIVLTLFTAMSIHSLMDGAAIASYNGHDHNNSVFAAILVHKFPEGLALAALMFSSNYSKGKIILYVTLIEMVTIVGAVLGHYLFASGVSGTIISLITAHIAGGFVFLAFHAVLGEMYKNHKGLVISSFLAGLMTIYLVQLLF